MDVLINLVLAGTSVFALMQVRRLHTRAELAVVRKLILLPNRSNLYMKLVQNASVEPVQVWVGYAERTKVLPVRVVHILRNTMTTISGGKTVKLEGHAKGFTAGQADHSLGKELEMVVAVKAADGRDAVLEQTAHGQKLHIARFFSRWKRCPARSCPVCETGHDWEGLIEL